MHKFDEMYADLPPGNGQFQFQSQSQGGQSQSRSRASAPLPGLRAMAGAPAGRGDARPPRRSGDDFPARGHHLRGVRRQGRGRRRHRAADPVRPDPPHHPGRRVGRHGKGPGPARHGAEPLPARRLSRPGHHQGRHHPRRADPEQRPVPQGDGGRVRAAPRLLAHRGRRHRARAQCEGRGRVLRAGRQPAGAQRRELHAGRPQDDDAAVPRSVQRAPGGAGHALPRPAAGNPARLGASPARPIPRWWC